MKTKKIPQRKCVVCGQVKDKNDLLRIVNNKEEGIVVDESGRKNGRGAYICKSSQCIEKAKKTNKLAKVFKTEVNNDLYEEISAYEIK
ncbi:MAG: YlxR family protein [Peptoniphilaceae bacterium]|nr:YlxR family protein [Peptoniphilaceae bacterium]MDY6019067.1 YlxR family protein [Anaerococcus sp.]